MIEKPLVSVVLPCYNHEQYIGQAIESVLNQTYGNMELIVADNGSTDSSYEVISQYSDRISRIIRMEENSILFCSESLVLAATGEYIAFMTSDDYWEPDKLELQVQALQEHPEAAASAAWTVYVDDNLQPYGEGEVQGPFETEIFKVENKSRYEWFRTLLYNGNCLAWPSAVYRTDIYKELLYRWRGHRQLSDYYTWLCTVLKFDLYVVPKVLVRYRWHPNGENRNESTGTLVTGSRHMNEFMDIAYCIIEEVEDDFFLKAFGDELCCTEITSHEEVLCEKFFLLQRLSEKYSVIETSAILFYCNHFMEMRNVIHEKYHYTYADYHEWAGERGAGASSCKNDVIMHRVNMNANNRLWRLRNVLMDRAQTDEEYCEAIRMLFNSLESDEQELFRIVDKGMGMALYLMKEYQKKNVMETYQTGIVLLEEITPIVDQKLDELKFLGVDLKEEDWCHYREIIKYAKNMKIDLEESLIPYTEYIKSQLQIIVA